MVHFFTTTTATTINMSKIYGNSANKSFVWISLFREVCKLPTEKEPKLVVTTKKPIEIDESLLVAVQNMAKEYDCVVTDCR